MFEIPTDVVGLEDEHENLLDLLRKPRELPLASTVRLQAVPLSMGWAVDEGDAVKSAEESASGGGAKAAAAPRETQSVSPPADVLQRAASEATAAPARERSRSRSPRETKATATPARARTVCDRLHEQTQQEQEQEHKQQEEKSQQQKQQPADTCKK